MSLKIVHLASDIEHSDDFHIARILLLMAACSGKSRKSIQGIMKLAKMDFLLRYPNCLVRVLLKLGKDAEALKIPDEERFTIEAKMIRFRFGPWDKRYRRWIGTLVSKGLADTYLAGRTVNIKLTEEGFLLASKLGEMDEFKALQSRSKIIASSVGGYSAVKLKDFVYEVFPEIVGMQWGKEIDI